MLIGWSNLRTAVGVNEAVGDEGQQLLLRHLARIRVQADHVLQQQHVTCNTKTRAPKPTQVNPGATNPGTKTVGQPEWGRRGRGGGLSQMARSGQGPLSFW